MLRIHSDALTATAANRSVRHTEQAVCLVTTVAARVSQMARKCSKRKDCEYRAVLRSKRRDESDRNRSARVLSERIETTCAPSEPRAIPHITGNVNSMLGGLLVLAMAGVS